MSRGHRSCSLISHYIYFFGMTATSRIIITTPPGLFTLLPRLLSGKYNKLYSDTWFRGGCITVELRTSVITNTSSNKAAGGFRRSQVRNAGLRAEKNRICYLEIFHVVSSSQTQPPFAWIEPFYILYLEIAMTAWENYTPGLFVVCNLGDT